MKPIGGLIEEAYDGSASFLYRVDQAETAVRLLRESYPELSAGLVTEHEFSIRLKPSAAQTGNAAPFHQELALYNSFLIRSGIALYTVSETQDHTLEDAFIRLTDEGGNQIVKLIQNEYIKLFTRRTTQLLILLLLAAAVGMAVFLPSASVQRPVL